MIELDTERYDRQIKESRPLYEVAARFEEPARVPIALTTGAPYYCSLFGVKLEDYYTDWDCQLEVQLKGIKWAFEVLGDDREGYAVGLDIGIVREGLLFDCEIAYPENYTPRIIPRIETRRDIEELEVPDPETHPKVLEVLRRREEYERKVRKMGLRVPVGKGFGGIHPPLSAACAIMNPTLFYALMIEDPPAAKMLLDKMFQTFCRVQDFNDKLAGRKTTRLGLADDNSAFISNKMYREFVYDYNMALYEKYGTEYRSFHADGPNDHHSRMYAEEFKLDRMDAGGFSDIEIAKRELGGKVLFSGGLNGRQLYFRTFEQAKADVCRALRICAPGGGYIFAIGGETMPGIPEQTLIDMVRFVKEAGKYPIDEDGLAAMESQA